MDNRNRNRRGLTSLRQIGALLGLLVLPWMSGCVVVAAGAVGAGAVAYVRGELSASVEDDLDAVYRAAQAALAKQEFIRIEERKSGIDAQLVHRTALDKRIVIKLERVTDRLTEVKIRVGLVGDQDISLNLLDQIRAELK